MGKSHPWRWPVGFLLRRSGRERVSTRKLGDLCASAPSLQDYPMPSRMTQESYRPGVSDRTMVGNSATTLACECQKTERRRHEANMKLLGWKRRIGASSLRGLQGRSATNQNGQAAEGKKERTSCGLDPAKTFLASGSGRSIFRLTSPYIGLPCNSSSAQNGRKHSHNSDSVVYFAHANVVAIGVIFLRKTTTGH
jgi:hypothetical protein